MSSTGIDFGSASRSDQSKAPDTVCADFHLCRHCFCRHDRVWWCSTFLQRGSAAVTTGFVVFILAWVMLLVVAFGFPFSTNYSKGFVALFSLFPWTVLGKGIRDLASATTGGFTPWSMCNC